MSVLRYFACFTAFVLAWVSARAESPAPSLSAAPSVQIKTIVLEGTATHQNDKSYLELPFEVPAGYVRMTVTLDYDRANHSVIDLGVFDPNGFRGYSGGNKTGFTLAAADATPSYLPGPIFAGEWKILLGVDVKDGVKARYRAEIKLEPAGAKLPVSAFFDGPIKTGAAWYRGDFHMHTAHSDGSCNSLTGRRVPCPVFRTLEGARRAQLDFIAVTDHNTFSHQPQLRELQAYYDDILIIPGREITTYYGHTNVFGAMGWIDFELGTKRLPTINKYLDEVQEQGGIASINHPAYSWMIPDTDYSRMSAVEVANGGQMHDRLMQEGPKGALAFWQNLLDQGYHLTGIGGSDNHDPDGPEHQSPIGRPTTVVWADSLSQRAIFAGVHSGRVFVDLDGASWRLLDLEAQAADQKVAMGGTLRLRRGESATLGITVKGVPGCRVEIVSGAQAPKIVLADPVVKGGDEHLVARLSGVGKRSWVRVNVRSANGLLLMIGNPIYIAPE